MASLFQRLVLRYGVFFLLVLMSVGMLYFICSFELRTRSSIHLFHDRHDNSWYGYIPESTNIPYSPCDTLIVEQTTTGGSMSFIVEGVVTETGMLRLKLSLIGDCSRTDTYIQGFIHVGKEKIKDKILNRSLL